MIHRSLVLGGLAFGAVLVATACATAPVPPAATTAAATASPVAAGAGGATAAAPTAAAKVQLADTVKLAVSFFNDVVEPQSLPGPAYIQADQMFDGLTQRSADGVLQPALAASWAAAGPSVWEFKLRPGVTFHDGTPLTANDVKFSYERLLDPAERVPAIAQFSTVDRVEAPDAQTVRIVTKGPDPLMPARVILAKIIPERAFRAAGAGNFGRAPIGTGPWKFQEFRSGNAIVYQAYPQSWRGAPAMPTAQLIKIPEDATMVASLKTGEIDMANDFSVDSEKGVRDAGIDVVPNVRTATHTIDLNQLQFDELKDKRVRQALNYAVDKQAINQATSAGYSKIADGQLVPRGVNGYNPVVSEYPYDQARARRLLAEAGRAAGFSGALTTLPGPNTLIAQAVAGAWNAVGVRAEVQSVESGIYLQRFSSGQKGMFFLSPFNYGTLIDADQPLSNFRSGNPAATRRWENPAFDAVYEPSRTELDPARRLALLQEAAAILREDAPSLFLFQQGYVVGVSKKVGGYTPRLDNSIRFDQLTRAR